MKRLENELDRAHESAKSMDQRIKELEQQLWHKGEHIARIEGDLRNVYAEKDQLRRENERLNSVVSAEKGGQGVDVSERIAKEVDEVKAQYEAKAKELQEQKGKMDWRLGEVTKLWNDAKWRLVGAVDGLVERRTNPPYQRALRSKVDTASESRQYLLRVTELFSAK